MGATATGWWDTHDAAWRRARRLFVGSALVVALYLAGLLAIAVVVSCAVLTGSGDAVEQWIGDAEAVGVTAVAIAVFVVSAAVIALAGWRGLPARSLRYSRARPPQGHEADHVRSEVATFGLAYGMPRPRVWVIDDPAPNALAFGRRTAGNVCVTTGALGLPRDELDALVMFHVAALASRAFAYATSAADLILLGEWCTRVLWGTAGLAILTPLLGVRIEVAAAYVVGTAALVVVTRPMLAFAARGLVGLIDDTAELVDLETMRHSNEPAALARLLIHLVKDSHQVKSRWEIAHLWFERDVVDLVDMRTWPSRVLANIGPGDIGLAGFAGSNRHTRQALLQRAATAVDQAGGGERLRREFRNAELRNARRV